MNLLYFILQAEQGVENVAAGILADPAAGAAAEAANEAAQTAPKQQPWVMWAMLIGIFVIMWFFMIRPQRKAQKEQQAFLNAIEKGTKVVTAGGIYGVVAEVKENTLIIEVDNGVKIKVSKASVQRDPADMPAPAKK